MIRIAAGLAMLLLAVPMAGAEAASLGFGAGLFDTSAFVEDEDFDAIEAGLVWRGPRDLAWGIGPMAGLSATDDGAYWLYVGARRPFAVGARWQLGLNFGAAYYEAGDSKDLGHALEFRSGLELNRKLQGGSTLGLEFYHLSNAGLSDTNPGANSLWIVYAVPLGR